MSIELPVQKYEPSEFVCTSLGNKISKSAHVFGSQQITFSGKCILMDDTIIRGDLSGVHVGTAVYIGSGTVVRPCSKIISSGITYFPLRIGTRVIIEQVWLVEVL
jgi:dynactin-5